MRNLCLVCAAALLSILIPGMGTPSTERARAAPPTHPNVLFILTDDQRADQMRAMPALRRFVIGEGVTFSNAIAPNAVCCPSRASFLTGDHSHTTRVWTNGQPFGGFPAFNDARTLATTLDAGGYRTGLFGKYLNGYHYPAYVPPGWDEWFAALPGRPFAYRSIRASHNGVEEVHRGEYTTVGTYRRVRRFIVGTPPGTPFFAMWTPRAPHAPTTPQARYADRFARSRFPRSPSFNEADVRDKPRWIRRLDRLTVLQRRQIHRHRLDMIRTLRSVDDGVRLLIRTLVATGRLDDTIVVFASDNGYMLGEHRIPREKGFPYRAVTEIPLIVRYDPITRGMPRVHHSLVANIDLAPTVATLAGLSMAGDPEGLDLTPILRRQVRRVRTKIVVEHARGGRAPAYCGTRTKNQLYVRYAAGSGQISEYYHYGRDPHELDNRILTKKPRIQRVIARLRAYAVANCTPEPPGFSWR